MKKIIGLLMLAIFVLFGCSSNDTASLEGKTITVATTVMAEDNPYSEQAIAERDPNETASKQAMLDTFQEETGVTIEFIEIDGETAVEDISKSVLAGDPIADVVRVNSGQYYELLAAGMLSDISNVLNAHLESGDMAIDTAFQTGEAFGAYYGVPRDLYTQPSFLVYDITLLEQAGMTETPLDMWLADNWTWSTAEAYMKEVDAALGDSIDAVWGDEPYFVFNYGLGSNGVNPISPDGTINFTSPEAYEAIEYYKGLYDDGILKFYVDETGAPVWADSQSAWEKGYTESTGTQETSVTVFTTLEGWRSDCCIKNTDKEYGFVPYPRNDDITKEEFVVPQGPGDMYVVPKGVEDVDAAAEVAVFMNKLANNAAYDPAIGQTAEQNYESWFSTNSSEEGNEAVAVYASQQMQLDLSAFFLTGIDFSFAQALTDYYVEGVSITSAFDAAVPQVEQNITDLESKVSGEPQAIEAEPAAE